MFEAIETIRNALTEQFGYPWIAVAILAALPIVEARLAVPMALSCGMGKLQSFVTAFLGSSLPAPLLLLALIPFIRWLAKTRVFRRLGETVYDKFVQKSKKVDENASDLKKMLALFVFVAIPLPLTGVWTGTAIAVFLGMKFKDAVLPIAAGNLVAGLIIELLAELCIALWTIESLDYVLWGLFALAAVLFVITVVKMVTGKGSEKKDGGGDGDGQGSGKDGAGE